MSFSFSKWIHWVRFAVICGAVGLLYFGIGFGLAGAKAGHTHTHYDGERDLFMTRGEVQIDVPLKSLCAVAGDFPAYGEWTLYGINKRPDGGHFTIILKNVDYVPGGTYGLGTFNVTYDLDIIWPFGRTGQVIPFQVTKVQKRPDGGIDRLEVALESDSLLLEKFMVALRASGDENKAVVNFKSQVGFVGLVDAFFTLSTFRKNIEWRIVRVLQNLKRQLQLSEGPPHQVPSRP